MVEVVSVHLTTSASWSDPIALATFALALVTVCAVVVAARSARDTRRLAENAEEEVKALREQIDVQRDEVAAVASQVKVQERQLALSVDPMVWPVTPVEWAKGQVAERNTYLHLQNGGGGPALGAEGDVSWQPGGGADRRTAKILPVTIAGGSDVIALLGSIVESWDGARAVVRYNSIDKKSWQTDAVFKVVAGGIIVSQVLSISDRTLPEQVAAHEAAPDRRVT
jgi:hypothetical protein